METVNGPTKETVECSATSRSTIGGGGYDDPVPGEVTKTAPSGDRTACSTTWSPSLPRNKLISPENWSIMSTEGAIFVPSPPKTGTNFRHPPPSQSLNDSSYEQRAAVTDSFVAKGYGRVEDEGGTRRSDRPAKSSSPTLECHVCHMSLQGCIGNRKNPAETAPVCSSTRVAARNA